MDLFMSLLLAAIAAGAATAEGARWRRRQLLWRKSGIATVDSRRARILSLASNAARHLPVCLGHLVSEKKRKKMEDLVTAAGLEVEGDGRFIVLMQGGGALLGMAIAFAILPAPPVVAFGIGAVLGALAWPMQLKARVRRRRQAIERTLPNVLDWLALSVEAGEGFSQALDRIAGRFPAGPLRDELKRLLAEMRTGVPRRVALSSLARRAGVPSLSSLAALLIQADVLGTGIGPVLRSVSGRLRVARFARAERQGVVAAQTALFPLIFCIMPATFIVVFGPFFIRLLVWGPQALLGR